MRKAKIRCRHCKKLFEPNGIGRHEKMCRDLRAGLKTTIFDTMEEPTVKQFKEDKKELAKQIQELAQEFSNKYECRDVEIDIYRETLINIPCKITKVEIEVKL